MVSISVSVPLAVSYRTASSTRRTFPVSIERPIAFSSTITQDFSILVSENS